MQVGWNDTGGIVAASVVAVSFRCSSCAHVGFLSVLYSPPTVQNKLMGGLVTLNCPYV